MQDYVFSLGGVEFGRGADIEVNTFDPGDVSVDTQDQNAPIGDGTAFGTDYLRGATWNFSMFTNKDDDTQALAALSPLATAWRALQTRRTPGAVEALRYQHAGRVRRVYGRPRRWAVMPGEKILTGNIGVQADFATVDHLHYDDTEQAITLGLVGEPGGGLLIPADAPFIFAGSAVARPGIITGGGDSPAGFTSRIDGPVVGPYLTGPGWDLTFPGYSLAAGEWIDIDTNGWAMTVLKNGISSVAGALSRKSRLASARIAPGGQEIIFGGTSVTGTASCAVRWRPAWNSL